MSAGWKTQADALYDIAAELVALRRVRDAAAEVVAMHDNDHGYCAHCGGGAQWRHPCPTRLALTAALPESEKP